MGPIVLTQIYSVLQNKKNIFLILAVLNVLLMLVCVYYYYTCLPKELEKRDPFELFDKRYNELYADLDAEDVIPYKKIELTEAQ